MDRDVWLGLYRRLLTAYGKQNNAEQASVYFSALGHLPASAVEHAVTESIRASRGWPTAADLAERARGYLASRGGSRAVCDICHGNGWLTEAGAPEQRTMPALRQGLTETAYIFTPEYARRCQCRDGGYAERV